MPDRLKRQIRENSWLMQEADVTAMQERRLIGGMRREKYNSHSLAAQHHIRLHDSSMSHAPSEYKNMLGGKKKPSRTNATSTCNALVVYKP